MRLTPEKNWYCASLNISATRACWTNSASWKKAGLSENYRGNASKELRKLANVALVDAELESLNLFKLLRAFERVMQRYEDKEARKTVHTVMRYSYTIADQQEYIFSRIQPKKPAKFEDLFGKLENRMHAIVTFLALLEMLNLQLLVMTQRLGTNNFWIELPSPQSDEEE
jgi:segregation and condensation protein A